MCASVSVMVSARFTYHNYDEKMSVQINSVSVSRVCGVLFNPSFRGVAGQARVSVVCICCVVKPIIS